MALSFNSWAEKVKPSPTLALYAKALLLQEQGKKLYNFGIGETNRSIKCPAVLKQFLIDAIRNDETYYTQEGGDPELLDALRDDLRLNFNLDYECSQILVCPGPKDAMFKCMMAMLSPEKSLPAKNMGHRYRVAAFSPLYEAFENLGFMLTGYESIIIPTKAPLFLPDPSEVRHLLATQPICAVIINSPNNPAGAVYPHALMRSLAQVFQDFPDVWIISDEVYRTIIYPSAIDKNSHHPDTQPHDKHQPSYLSIASLLPQQTIVIAGMSKEVSGTGLRLGFAAGPSRLIKLARAINGNTSSCVHLPTQRAYARFLKADRDMAERQAICHQLQQRRDRFITLFSQMIPDAIYTIPQGAFYFFPDMRPYFGRLLPDNHQGTLAPNQPIRDDEELALYLLESAGVVALPGSKMAYPGHLRFAYSVDFSVIEEGVKVMAEALARLRSAAAGL